MRIEHLLPSSLLGGRPARVLQLKWETRAKTFLQQICGTESHCFTNFENASAGSSMATTWDRLKQNADTVPCCKEDFEKGYLTSVRSEVRCI
jgi:hypothetical protein